MDEEKKKDQIDDDTYMNYYEEDDSEKDVKPSRSMAYEILTFGRDLALILIVFWLITTFVGEKTSVIGNSMEPHIHNGDAIILSKVNYYFDNPQRFDVVVFPYNNGEANYIKRIIGLPGETIDLRLEDRNYNIYINGEPLDDFYGIEEIKVHGNQAFPLTIPEGEYFVMGDNRNDSSDSRYQDVGTIPKKDFLGKAWLRIWPISGWGFVE